MTQLRFGGGNAGDPWGYQAAKWMYDLPQTAKQSLAPKVGDKLSGFIGNQLKSDFSQYTSVSLGRFKTLLAEPPRLPLLLLLYPGTVGPRLYRAYQRGKENNDFREMADVLRRDLTAITLFVFALAPLVYGVSKFTQSRTGVNLVKPKEGAVLSYSDFRNYKIDSPQALWQVVKEGNGEGLEKAINHLNDGGLKEKHGLSKVSDALEQLKQGVKNFVANHAPRPGAARIDESAVSKAAQETFEKFETVDTCLKEVLDQGKESGSKQILKIATNLQGQAKGALENYAKVRRLPSDMLSFGVLIAFIGWFPMWFNGIWNKKQFEKKHAFEEQTSSPVVDKAPVIQPMMRPAGFRPQVPPAFSQAMVTNPFGLAQRPVPGFSPYLGR